MLGNYLNKIKECKYKVYTPRPEEKAVRFCYNKQFGTFSLKFCKDLYLGLQEIFKKHFPEAQFDQNKFIISYPPICWVPNQPPEYYKNEERRRKQFNSVEEIEESSWSLSYGFDSQLNYGEEGKPRPYLWIMCNKRKCEILGAFLTLECTVDILNKYHKHGFDYALSTF